MALARPRPDPALARELGLAAREAAESGPGRSPRSSTSWPPTGRRASSPTSAWSGWRGRGDRRPRQPSRAAQPGPDRLPRRACHPGQAVRVRLAVPELAGCGPAASTRCSTAALADAGDDDRLVAMVLLQRARMALMESRPVVGRRCRRTGRGPARSAGGQRRARGRADGVGRRRRWLGLEHGTYLDRAVGLAPGSRPASCTPRRLTCRPASPSTTTVSTRHGPGSWGCFPGGAGCRHGPGPRPALPGGGGRTGGAARSSSTPRGPADRRRVRAGRPHRVVHPGLAELAGGDLARARTLAERGAAAAEERGDTRYLQRHLVLLGPGAAARR